MAFTGEEIVSIEQNVTIAQIQAQQLGAQSQFGGLTPPSTGFVDSINGLGGLLTIAGGANIGISSDGVSTITIRVTGIGTAAMAQSKVTNVAPTPSNDESEGYSVFSMWLNTNGPTFYMCSSAATMAAVWVALN